MLRFKFRALARMFFSTGFWIILTSLYYVHRADSLNCTSVYGQECIFPVFHRGKFHFRCSEIFDNETQKCSVKVDEKFISLREERCDENCNELPLCNTTLKNICKFPFKYNDREYSSCTTAQHNDHWCAISLVDGEANNWGICAESETCPIKNKDSKCKTNEGHPCQFPFLYKGKIREKCQKDLNGLSWCATSVNDHGIMMTKGSCTSGCPGFVETRHGCKTVKGLFCMFPFEHDGNYFTECTKLGHNDYWCAVSVSNELESISYDLCDKMDKDCFPNGSNHWLVLMVLIFVFALVTNVLILGIIHRGKKWVCEKWRKIMSLKWASEFRPERLQEL